MINSFPVAQIPPAYKPFRKSQDPGPGFLKSL